MKPEEEADQIIAWVITETGIDPRAEANKQHYFCHVCYLTAFLIKTHTTLNAESIAGLLGRHKRKIYDWIERIHVVLNSKTYDNIEIEIKRLNKLYNQTHIKNEH